MDCIVRHCKSSWRPKSDIKFHRFPKDVDRRQHWLSIVPIKGRFTENSKICSLHFKVQEYDQEKPGHLIKNATPYYLPLVCGCEATKDCQQPVENDYEQDSKENFSAGSSSSTSPIHTDNKPLSSKTHAEETVYVFSGHDSKEPVTDKEGPPAKRRCLLRDCLTDMRVKRKSPREVALAKKIKILKQKVARQTQKIEDMSTVIEIARNYTRQSEIENILNGNFANICKALNKNPSKAKALTKYSEEVKAFALTVYSCSPMAYEYLRSFISLPHSTTLTRKSRSIS